MAWQIGFEIGMVLKYLYLRVLYNRLNEEMVAEIKKKRNARKVKDTDINKSNYELIGTKFFLNIKTVYTHRLTRKKHQNTRNKSRIKIPRKHLNVYSRVQ